MQQDRQPALGADASDTQEEGDWFNMNGNAKRCVQTCWGKRTQQRLVAHGMQEKTAP